jgi:hypothetical protein
MNNELAFDNHKHVVCRVYQSNGFGVRGQSAVCLRLGRQLSSVPARQGPGGVGAYLDLEGYDSIGIEAEIRKLPRNYKRNERVRYLVNMVEL